MFRNLLLSLAVVGLTLATQHAGAAASPTSDGPSSTKTEAVSSARSLPSPDVRVARAEQWWRVHLYELDRGRWRSAGTFENPDRGRCIRYGNGWVAGKPGYRTYTGPVGFLR